MRSDIAGHRGAIMVRRVSRFRYEAIACLGGRAWTDPIQGRWKTQAARRALARLLSTPNRADRRALERLAR